MAEIPARIRLLVALEQAALAAESYRDERNAAHSQERKTWKVMTPKRVHLSWYFKKDMAAIEDAIKTLRSMPSKLQ